MKQPGVILKFQQHQHKCLSQDYYRLDRQLSFCWFPWCDQCNLQQPLNRLFKWPKHQWWFNEIGKDNFEFYRECILSKISSERFTDVRNDAVNFNMNIFGNINITPTWGITVFGFYNSPKLTTQGKQATWFVYNIGARKELWKKKGAVSFGVDNIFHQWMNINSDFESPEFSFSSKNRIEGWGVRASVEYRFGKMEFGAPQKKKKKGALNDDLKQGDGDGEEWVLPVDVNSQRVNSFWVSRFTLI